jgi:hypothetical protein
MQTAHWLHPYLGLSCHQEDGLGLAAMLLHVLAQHPAHTTMLRTAEPTASLEILLLQHGMGSAGA